MVGCWGRWREGHEVGADRAPAATGDLGVLGAVFDSDGDGRLTAAASTFGSFKVMATKADGTSGGRTLAQLGITKVDLMGDATGHHFLEAPRWMH